MHLQQALPYFLGVCLFLLPFNFLHTSNRPKSHSNLYACPFPSWPLNWITKTPQPHNLTIKFQMCTLAPSSQSFDGRLSNQRKSPAIIYGLPSTPHKTFYKIHHSQAELIITIYLSRLCSPPAPLLPSQTPSQRLKNSPSNSNVYAGPLPSSPSNAFSSAPKRLAPSPDFVAS